MAEPMSTAERTALWATLFGLGVAVASLALPSAFDLPSYLWRVAFCLGITVSAISAFFIGYENFAKAHPNARARRTRTATFSIVGARKCCGTTWASLVPPAATPRRNRSRGT